MSSRTPGSRRTASDESSDRRSPDGPANHQPAAHPQARQPATTDDGRGAADVETDGTRSTTDTPVPGIYRLRYGDEVDRSLPVALDDVLVSAGLDDARRDVGFAVDVESIERLALDTWFAVSVEFAGGELRITDDAVHFDRR